MGDLQTQWICRGIAWQVDRAVRKACKYSLQIVNLQIVDLDREQGMINQMPQANVFQAFAQHFCSSSTLVLI